jgi:hypothetical protein
MNNFLIDDLPAAGKFKFMKQYLDIAKEFEEVYEKINITRLAVDN